MVRRESIIFDTLRRGLQDWQVMMFSWTLNRTVTRIKQWYDAFWSFEVSGLDRTCIGLADHFSLLAVHCIHGLAIFFNPDLLYIGRSGLNTR